MTKIPDKKIAETNDQWWDRKVNEEYKRLLSTPQALETRDEYIEYSKMLWKKASMKTITEAFKAGFPHKPDDAKIRQSTDLEFDLLLKTPEAVERRAKWDNYLKSKRAEAITAVRDMQLKALDVIFEGIQRDWPKIPATPKLTPEQIKMLWKEERRLEREFMWVKTRAVFYALGEWLKSWFKHP